MFGAGSDNVERRLVRFGILMLFFSVLLFRTQFWGVFVAIGSLAVLAGLALMLRKRPPRN